MDSKFALDIIKKSFVGGKGTIYPNEWETIRSDLESQTTAVQQLKAEIAAMLTKWNHCCNLGEDWYEVEAVDVERLRQLSAI